MASYMIYRLARGSDNGGRGSSGYPTRFAFCPWTVWTCGAVLYRYLQIASSTPAFDESAQPNRSPGATASRISSGKGEKRSKANGRRECCRTIHGRPLSTHSRRFSLLSLLDIGSSGCIRAHFYQLFARHVYCLSYKPISPGSCALPPSRGSQHLLIAGARH